MVELNWLWLPTVIGMNTKLKEQLEKKLSSRIVGMVLTDASLEQVNHIVIDALCEEFPYVTGLKEYLQALEHLQLDATL